MPKGQKNTWKRKYATAELLKAKCDEYFNKCDAEEKLYGEAGLALHLGVKLDTLRKWYDGKDCEDYQEIVQMAYLRIQSQLESEPTYMEKGMVFAGTSPDDRLVEAVEIKDHPFFLGVQFHPEFKSRPNRPHPCFRSFIEAAINA